MQEHRITDVKVSVDGVEIDMARQVHQSVLDLARACSRDALLQALNGTDADRLHYAIMRGVHREMVALWVWGTFVNDPTRFDKAARHAMHQAERLNLVSMRMGAWKP